MNQQRIALDCAVRMRTFISSLTRLCVVLLLMVNASCTYRSAVDKPLVKWTPELDEQYLCLNFEKHSSSSMSF